MPRKYRYLLLLLGFIIFSIASPLIIMYVQGVTFSKNDQKYTLTGIFAVKTNPKGAQIFINNQLKDTSPANLRFLPAGEYDIAISKEGYLTWKKRLIIEAGKVTWVNPNPTEIFLFKQNPDIQTISENVDNFLATSQTLIAVQGNNLLLFPESNSSSYVSVPVTEPILNLSSNNSQDTLVINTKNHTYIYDLKNSTLKDISSLVGNNYFLPGPYPYLFVKQKNNLKIVNWQTNTSSTLWSNIIAFGSNQDGVYGLISDSDQTKLVASFLKDNFISTDTLVSNLSRLTNPTLIATQQKLVFVLDNGTLYRVGFNLEKIADNVTAYHYDAVDGSLAFTTPGEMDYYSFSDSESKLINRSTESFKDFFIRSSMAYSFDITTSKLEMRELDNRGGQNAYTLVKSNDLKKTTLSYDGSILYYLDGKVLKSLSIR